MGDRTLTKEPTPILMPPRKAWDWVKVRVATDGLALITYYKGEPSNRGTLWTPPVGSEETEATVPRLLHIPLVLFDKIRMGGRPLVPHEVLSIILEYVESIADKAPEVGQAWQLAMQWCVVAAQRNSQGDSHVAFSVDAITETDDAIFCQWAETRLNGTMGTKPTTPGAMAMPLGGTHPQAHGQFAAELGRGGALGLQALGPLKPSAGNQGGGGESESKPLYTEEDIAALMGFSHVKRGSDLQDIWTYFQTSKGKNLDVC